MAHAPVHELMPVLEVEAKDDLRHRPNSKIDPR
jgi:hypothetical protein